MFKMQEWCQLRIPQSLRKLSSVFLRHRRIPSDCPEIRRQPVSDDPGIRSTNVKLHGKKAEYKVPAYCPYTVGSDHLGRWLRQLRLYAGCLSGATERVADKILSPRLQQQQAVGGRPPRYASAPCKLTISSYLFARWHLFQHVGYLRHQQQVDRWTFDLETGVRVTCNMGKLCKF